MTSIHSIFRLFYSNLPPTLSIYLILILLAKSYFVKLQFPRLYIKVANLNSTTDSYNKPTIPLNPNSFIKSPLASRLLPRLLLIINKLTCLYRHRISISII